MAESKIYVIKEHGFLAYKKPSNNNIESTDNKKSGKEKKTTDNIKLIECEDINYSNGAYIINDNLLFCDGNIDFREKEYDPETKYYYYSVGNKGKKFFECDRILLKHVDNSQEEIKEVFKGSYLIGAQWVHEKAIKNGKFVKKGDEKEKFAVVVTPKIEDIDYSEMFMTCLKSGIESKDFSKLYNIDFESKDGYICAPNTSSFLNPLMISHFVTIVEKLLKKGIKKDYVYKCENLKKPKGKININLNERKNIMTKRYDRCYCNYSEYSIDNPENRIIKRALIFSKKMLEGENYENEYINRIRKALSAFDGVSDQIQISEIKNVKTNKLFREYPETVRLAKNILRRYGYSLTNINPDYSKEVPPFWIDMAGLFEHYTLVKLKHKFGEKIKYQFDKGVKFGWRPDMLLSCERDDNHDPMILDAKYIPELKRKIEENGEEYIIRQLSGYAREKTIRKCIGIKDDETPMCVLIYPIKKKPEEKGAEKKTFSDIKFEKDELKDYIIDGLQNFYAIPLEVPMLNKQT